MAFLPRNRYFSTGFFTTGPHPLAIMFEYIWGGAVDIGESPKKVLDVLQDWLITNTNGIVPVIYIEIKRMFTKTKKNKKKFNDCTHSEMMTVSIISRWDWYTTRRESSRRMDRIRPSVHAFNEADHLLKGEVQCNYISVSLSRGRVTGNQGQSPVATPSGSGVNVGQAHVGGHSNIWPD